MVNVPGLQNKAKASHTKDATEFELVLKFFGSAKNLKYPGLADLELENENV